LARKRKFCAAAGRLSGLVGSGGVRGLVVPDQAAGGSPVGDLVT
jgi:hypothetical protein